MYPLTRCNLSFLVVLWEEKIDKRGFFLFRLDVL